MIRRGRNGGSRTGTVPLPGSAICRRRRGMMSLSHCEVSRGGRGLCPCPGPRSIDRQASLRSLTDFSLDRFAIGLRWAAAQTCLGTSPQTPSSLRAVKSCLEKKREAAASLPGESDAAASCKKRGGIPP